MDMVINKLNSNDDLLNIVSISFIHNDRLYNASYVPSDKITIMLEEVIKYDNPTIYYKDSINMTLISVISRTSLCLDSPVKTLTTDDVDIATAAAIAAFKLGLTYSDLSVTMSNGDLNIML